MGIRLGRGSINTGVNWEWSLYVRVEVKSETEDGEEKREEERNGREEGGETPF